MLVLSRRLGEQIVIADNIVIEVVELRGDKVRIGITAPKEVSVHRREIYDEIHGAKDAKDGSANVDQGPQREPHAAGKRGGQRR